jgi:hypothetical protein
MRLKVHFLTGFRCFASGETCVVAGFPDFGGDCVGNGFSGRKVAFFKEFRRN